MIIIFSQDQQAIRELARNQANAPQATFGQLREAFQPSVPVGAKEPIFIVADDATRLINYQPAIGDKDAEQYWTAEQAMQQLDALLPQNFAGDVYVAARRTATPRSDVDFARTFRAQLVTARKSAGKVYGLASASLGPIPKPGDTRWLEAV